MDFTETSVGGLGGYRYICTIIDTSTGLIDARPCAVRLDAAIHLASFLDMNPHIKSVRVDGAAEFHSEQMKAVMVKRGVGLETIAPGVSESLGSAERANRTIKDKISVLLLSLGLEEKPSLWPFFVHAAAECINHTASPGRDGKSPVEVRRMLAGDNSTPEAPAFGFGEPVFFRTRRERTIKEPERLPNGHRIGIYISTIHSGMVEVLGFQRGNIVFWQVHPNLVSKADDNLLGKLHRKISWYATSFEDDVVRAFTVASNGKLGPEAIFSYPSLELPEVDDETDDDLPRKRKKRMKV